VTRRLRRLRHRWPQVLVASLLAAWAVALVLATARLSAWQHDVTQVLLQMRADDLLRSSVRARDQVQPAWYRQRALDLLGTVERLRDNTGWMAVMPGSWRVFDDLEARTAERIDATFGEWVVETLRRDLEARAAAWAGAQLDASTGQIVPAPATCSLTRFQAQFPPAAAQALGERLRWAICSQPLSGAMGATGVIQRPGAAGRPAVPVRPQAPAPNARWDGEAARATPASSGHSRAGATHP